MRTESVIMALKERQRSMVEGIFSQSPPNMESFSKIQGIWQGLGEAINIITEEARKEAMNDG